LNSFPSDFMERIANSDWEAMSEAERDAARLGLASIAPTDDMRLWTYVWQVLGFKLEYEAVIPGHRPPFEALADAYFQRVETALWEKSRTSCGTRMLSILHLLNSLFKPGCWTTNAGSSEGQSNRCYDYFRTYFEEAQHLADELKADPMMKRTDFRNGSRVEILTGGSIRSVSGPAQQIMACDEIDQWTMDVYETASQAPLSKGDIMAQTLLVSSRYFDYGLLKRLKDEAEERGIAVYNWGVWDVMQRCTDYPNGCEECCLFEWMHPVTMEREPLCGGNIGPRCDGHMTVRDVRKKFRDSSSRTFYVQQLLGEATREGLAFEHFVDMDWPQGNLRELPKDIDVDAWSFVAGVNWGWAVGHDATVEVMAQAPDGDIYFCDEWGMTRALPDEHRAAAVELGREWPVRMFWGGHDRPDLVASWQQHGIDALTCPSHKVREAVDAMTDMMVDAQGNRHLFVSPTRCPELLKDITQRWHRARRRDGTFGEAFAKLGDKYAQAARYAFMGGAKGGWSGIF